MTTRRDSKDSNVKEKTAAKAPEAEPAPITGIATDPAPAPTPAPDGNINAI